MITTQEKTKVLESINQSKLEYFQLMLSSAKYDDHEEFIKDFINDMSYLFSFCNEKRYQILRKKYDLQINMFEADE